MMEMYIQEAQNDGNMKLKLYQLDPTRCMKFLLEEFGGWGAITDEIIHSSIIATCGLFYCVAPESILNPENLYDFLVGWQIFPPSKEVYYQDGYRVRRVINYAHQIVIDLYFDYCNNHSHNSIIVIEDASASQEGEYFKETKRQFWTYRGEVIYVIDKPNLPMLREYVNYAKGYGFMPFITEPKLTNALPGQIISDVEAEDFIVNIQCFATSVYDGESYLIWIRNGNEELLDALQKRISITRLL